MGLGLLGPCQEAVVEVVACLLHMQGEGGFSFLCYHSAITGLFLTCAILVVSFGYGRDFCDELSCGFPVFFKCVLHVRLGISSLLVPINLHSSDMRGFLHLTQKGTKMGRDLPKLSHLASNRGRVLSESRLSLPPLNLSHAAVLSTAPPWDLKRGVVPESEGRVVLSSKSMT